MKRIIAMLLAAMLLLAGCAVPRQTDREGSGELTIAVASDLHYLAPALTDNGPLFQKVVANGDGKLMLDIETITEAFVEQMIDERPDLLILSGDLCFNGERLSHEELARKLGRIEQAGVQVLVMPGNHDLYASRALRYEGEGYEPVDSVDAEQFRTIYADFGYGEALSVDEASGSYVYAPDGGRRILMLDTNSLHSNSFPEESFTWLEKQLKQAKKAGAQVISVSHQNLLIHNGLFAFGYQIMNAEKLRELLVRYGVSLHLSGHMHIQHALTDGLTEILTSPLSMTPCRYAALRWSGGTLDYEARSVDVAAWAARQGLSDEKLLHFDEYAREFFRKTAYDKTFARCLAAGFTDEQAERMAAGFADANLSYFTGAGPDRDRLTAELAYWTEHAGEGMETAYLRGILEDDAPDPLKIVIGAGKSG